MILAMVAAALCVCATNDPIARISEAFQKDDAKALAEIARQPVAGVHPSRADELPALAWAAEKGVSWKFHYYQGVLLTELGRTAEAAQALDQIDGADEDTAFLFRATQRTGKARRADLVRARRLNPSWQAGSAMCAYYEETGDRAAWLREATRWIRRYPTNAVLRASHARALEANGQGPKPAAAEAPRQ